MVEDVARWYVRRDHQPVRQVPSRLVDEKHSMDTGLNELSDLCQMQICHDEVAAWQNECCSFAQSRTDVTEDVDRCIR